MSMRRSKRVEDAITAAPSSEAAWMWVAVVLVAAAAVLAFTTTRSTPPAAEVAAVSRISSDRREQESAARARARRHGVDSWRGVLDGRAGPAGHARRVGMQATTDSRPVHRVFVDGFWMDETEVTNEQFARFVKATGYVTVAERTPRAEDFPGAPPESLVARLRRLFRRPTMRCR